MVLDDLDSGQVIGSFTARFKLLIGGGNGAEGFSFNFAPDLPDLRFGQEGAGQGLTVSFDTSKPGFRVRPVQARADANLLNSLAVTVSPRPGESNVGRRPTLRVVLVDDATQVEQSSIKLSMDEIQVNAIVAKTGKQTTVTFQPSTELEILSSHSLQLVFSDNAVPAHVRTENWSFTTARSIQVTGQWNFDEGDLRATIGTNLEYGDGLDGRMKDHTAFGTTPSFGIPDLGGRPAKVMPFPQRSGYSVMVRMTTK